MLIRSRKYCRTASPFLFVDKIMEISEEGIIGVKNVNEDFSEATFGCPSVSGFTDKAMAQVGGILPSAKCLIRKII